MQLDPLPCSEIVYRAITRSSDINEDRRRVSPNAFIRRPRDVDGLSVNHHCSPRECGSALKRHGVVSLHVGTVRDIDVKLDVEPDEPTHANITGLPEQDGDLALAERLALQLATHARIIPRSEWS